MRLKTLKKLFVKHYEKEPEYYIDTGGRFEICGNHTDHNHGLCLVANCSLRIRCYLSKNDSIVRVKSKGYRMYSFDINNLKRSSADNKTKSLTKGILFKLKELGYKIGGFDAEICSDIPDGSGVSSSAAIESLFGYIISYLYNDGKIDPLVIAKVGQFSENVYFGKPCGLLDQIGTSFDSFNYIDFKNIDKPVIETLPFKFPLTLYLIKSEGNHSNLTPLYAAIPSSMYEVAKLLDNKSFLRDVEVDDVYSKINSLDIEDAKKRKAIHFYKENERVALAETAIKSNNLEQFLDVIRGSQKSSRENLENTFVKGEYEGSPQDIIDKVSEFLGPNGAIRIHGGGFKGTVLVFVKNKFTKNFDAFLKANYDRKKYFKVKISNKAVVFNKA